MGFSWFLEIESRHPGFDVPGLFRFPDLAHGGHWAEMGADWPAEWELGKKTRLGLGVAPTTMY